MATDDEKPEEFIFQSIPRSKREVVAKSAEARVTQTVKAALQSYLERFLSPQGIYRRQLDLTADFAIQFETRLSGPRDTDDPSIYQIQLARFWTELRAKLPAVLIVDTGFNYQNPGLGGITDSWPISRSTSSVQLTMLATVPIELHLADLSETTCGDLRDVMLYILGPLTDLNKAHVIRSPRPEDKWEVRLPFNFQPSGLERKPMGDDPKDSLWSTSISLEVVFEGLISIGFAKQVQPELYHIATAFEGVDPMGFRLEDGSAVPLPVSAPTLDSIKVPSKVKLNHPAHIAGDWVPAHAHFVTDDPRIALIDRNGTIIPKRIGSCKVHLMDFTPGLPGGPKPILSWDIKVVFE